MDLSIKDTTSGPVTNVLNCAYTVRSNGLINNAEIKRHNYIDEIFTHLVEHKISNSIIN